MPGEAQGSRQARHLAEVRGRGRGREVRDGAEERVDRLARQLVRTLTGVTDAQGGLDTVGAAPRASTAPGSGLRDERGAPGPDDVILDVQIDGIRVLLTRADTAAEETGRPLLSPREHEIARMVAKGYPNKTIAVVLEISTWTVSTHLRRMFAKLGVGSRAAMVAKLLEQGSAGGLARG